MAEDLCHRDAQVFSKERRLCLRVFAARGVAVGHLALQDGATRRGLEISSWLVASSDQEPDKETDSSAHYTSLE